MKTPISPPPSAKAVTRFKDCLLHPWSRTKEDAVSSLPIVAPSRAVGFPSRIAEFLLVFRLRARRRSAQSDDMMERALRMVLVTCKNWFSSSSSASASPRHD